MLFNLINAMETKVKGSAEKINNNACPLPAKEFIKCSTCSENPKANIAAFVSGMSTCGCVYIGLQKMYPELFYADNVLLKVIPPTLILIVPIFYFVQSTVDYVNNKSWEKVCDGCNKSANDKWRRGIWATSFIGLTAASILVIKNLI